MADLFLDPYTLQHGCEQVFDPSILAFDSDEASLWALGTTSSHGHSYYSPTGDELPASPIQASTHAENTNDSPDALMGSLWEHELVEWETGCSFHDTFTYGEIVTRYPPSPMSLSIETTSNIEAGDLEATLMPTSGKGHSHGIASNRFRPEQIEILETWFRKNERYPFPTKDQKSYLAGQCSLTPGQIQTWCSNRRSRLRKGKVCSLNANTSVF